MGKTGRIQFIDSERPWAVEWESSCGSVGRALFGMQEGLGWVPSTAQTGCDDTDL